MTEADSNHRRNARRRTFGPLADLGGRAASATLRPLTGAVGAVAEAGISLEQHAVDRLLESGEPPPVWWTRVDLTDLDGTGPG